MVVNHILAFLCPIVLMTSLFGHVVDGGALEPRPANWESPTKGLSVLFDMQGWFLNDLVQMKTIGDLIVQFNITRLSDFAEDKFVNQWEDWAIYVVGYAVCIAIGVLLAIILPLTGCCVCSYRSCRCCRDCCECNQCCSCCRVGRYRQEDAKWSCKRTGFSVAVGILVAILTASVSCSYVALGELRKQVEPFGVLDTALQSMYMIDEYILDTSDEIDTSITQVVSSTTDTLVYTFSNFPMVVTADLGMKAGVLPDLTNFETFSDSLPYLHGNLTAMDTSGAMLQSMTPTLDTQLGAVQSNLAPLLAMCSAYQECKDAAALLPDLTTSTNYSGLDNLAAPIVTIQLALMAGIVGDVKTGAQNFWDISIAVDAVLNGTLTSLVDNINQLEKEVNDAMVTMTEYLAQVNLTEYEEAIWDFKPTFQEYGLMTYWAFIGFTSLCTAIIFCYLMGLGLGLGLSPPSAAKTKCCTPTSDHGANFLLAGSALSFIFSWLIAVLTIVIFATGGIVETNFCRHIVSYDESMDQLESLIQTELKSTGMSYNISFKQTALDCQANKSLYVSTNIEDNGVNISVIMDLEQYGIYTLIDELQNATIIVIPPGGIWYLNGSVNSTMLSIAGALDTVNFTTYDVELSKEITKVNLTEYISLLETIVMALISDGLNILASQVQTEANALKLIHTSTYTSVDSQKIILQQTYDNVKNILAIFDLDPGLVRLSEAQSILNADGDAMVQASLVSLGDSVQVLLENFSANIEYTVRNDLGVCRSLFDAGALVVDGMCVYFLEPYNALWFCLGWFLLFDVIAVAFANELAFLFSAPCKMNHSAVNRVSPEPIEDTKKRPDKSEHMDLKKHSNHSGEHFEPNYKTYYQLPKETHTRPKSVVLTPSIPFYLSPQTEATSRGHSRTKVAPYTDSDTYFRSPESGYNDM